MLLPLPDRKKRKYYRTRTLLHSATPAGYVTRKAKYRVAPVGKTIIPGSLTMKPGTAWMAMPVPPECSWVNFRW